MARWIFNNRKTSTAILLLLFINLQLANRHVSETLGVLISGVFVLGACAIGIHLCKYKIAQCGARVSETNRLVRTGKLPNFEDET